MRTLVACTLAFCALALPATAAPGRPDGGRDCFLSTTWDGWSSAEGGDVLYFRIRRNEVFRLDLVPGSRVRKSGDTFLVNEVRGSAWICSPVDLDLTLSDTLGFRRPVLVKDLRRLTPAEVAALPRKERPY